MAFPSSKPTARSFDPGDYPIKTYKSQDGSEVRILYGSFRTNMRLSLTYENLPDAEAEEFIAHYDSMKGTFNTFDLSTNSLIGWAGNGPNDSIATDDDDWLKATYAGNKYRYERPPELVQVRNGISTVTISLIGVL